MKNILKIMPAMAVVLGLTACNDKFEDFDAIIGVEKVAVDSIKINDDTISLGSSLPIITYSKYLKNCEGFYDYQYEKDTLKRYVTPYKFKTDGVCAESTTAASQINFQPEQIGTYQFKFWQGTDAAGQNIWLDQTVVVE